MPVSDIIIHLELQQQ